MPIQPITIVIAGVDKFSNTIARSQKKIEAFGKTVSRVGKKMTLGVTLPLLAVGATALQTTADFEQSMLRVQNLTGATGQTFQMLEQQARDLGATTLHTASQAAEGMGFLGMAGFNTEQIMAAMPATLDLATAAQMELGRSADIVSNILTAYGKDASETTSVIDLMVDSFQSANTDMEQMAEAMKFVAPIAAGMKIPIEDTATAIGLLSNAGIQGAMAGTQLRGILGMLAQPSNEAREALSRLKIPKSAIVDSAGNIKDLGEVIRQFEISGASTADMLQIFGRRIGPGMAALVSQGSKAFNVLNTDLRDNAGSARLAAKAFEDSLIGQVKALQSAFQELGIAVFKDTGLLANLVSFVKGMISFVRRLTKISPQLLKLGLVFAAIAAAVGPLLVIIGSLITSFATVAGWVASAGGVIALLSNPIGWVIAGITALIALFVAMKMKFGLSISSMLTGLLALSGPIGWIAGAFIKNWGKILPLLKLIGLAFVGLGKLLMYVMWPVFKFLEKFGDLVSWIAGLILDVVNSIARLALPAWLEKKIGLDGGSPSPRGATEIMQSGMVNKNENTTNIRIDNRANANVRTQTSQGTVNMEVERGLLFQGGF